MAKMHGAIAEYIEIFYHSQRWHSKLGNVAPAIFAQQWQQRVAASCGWRLLLTTEFKPWTMPESVTLAPPLS